MRTLLDLDFHDHPVKSCVGEQPAGYEDQGVEEWCALVNQMQHDSERPLGGSLRCAFTCITTWLAPKKSRKIIIK